MPGRVPPDYSEQQYLLVSPFASITHLFFTAMASVCEMAIGIVNSADT